MGGAQIFRNGNGTHVLKAYGNTLELVSEERRIHTETTIYAPNAKYEEQISELNKQHAKSRWLWFFWGVGIGMFMFLALIILVRILMRSGGLR